MDWQQAGRMARTNPATAGSTRRWVHHARHEGPAPHRAPGSASGEGPGGRFAVATHSGGDLIALDGSSGEGGGQILRSALTLSLLTGRSFRIRRIRAKRSQPGLRPQHLKAVEAAALLADAQVVGGSVGSLDLTFRPGAVRPRDLAVRIGTAGSTALVLQTLHLPIALKAEGPVRLTLTGGTFNESAPSFPFLESTWRGHLAALGLPVALAMPSSGYYPEGGGTLEAWIEPGQPKGLVLEDRGHLRKVRIVAETTHLDGRIADRMARRAEAALIERGIAVEASTIDRPGLGRGASISLIAEFAAGAPATFLGLGRLGRPAETVADDAVEQLLDHLDAPGGAVDHHSADQLLLPLAFALGRSVYTVTRATGHLRTNVATIRAFLDRPIRVEESGEGEPARVVVG